MNGPAMNLGTRYASRIGSYGDPRAVSPRARRAAVRLARFYARRGVLGTDYNAHDSLRVALHDADPRASGMNVDAVVTSIYRRVLGPDAV